MSMERNELLLALRCCSGGDCGECPLHRRFSAKCIGSLLREALEALEVDSVTLRECAEARTSLAKRLAEAQQSLHEKTSEFDALMEGVRECADCCILCANTDSNPDCELDGECENCETPCACYNCDEKASKFVWKGAAHG